MQRRHFMIAGAAGRTVRIGQSASLTGTQTQYGKDVSLGIAAAFAAANKAGGPGELNLELQALDDSGVKERVVANAKTHPAPRSAVAALRGRCAASRSRGTARCRASFAGS